jgi:hypothetical protein
MYEKEKGVDSTLVIFNSRKEDQSKIREDAGASPFFS